MTRLSTFLGTLGRKRKGRLSKKKGGGESERGKRGTFFFAKKHGLKPGDHACRAGTQVGRIEGEWGSGEKERRETRLCERKKQDAELPAVLTIPGKKKK